MLIKDKLLRMQGEAEMEEMVSQVLLMEKAEGVNIDYLREMLKELSNVESK